MRQEVFRMEHVTYRENGITYLNDLNLNIFRGEILGMLSMNAYGMPAFLQLLQVNLPIHDGYIYDGSEQINSWKDSNRRHNRISIIRSSSSLVEHLTVAENIFVVRQGFGQEMIHSRLLDSQLAPFLEDIGIEIPSSARIEDLTMFQRILVELLKAVVMGQHLIVLYDVGTLIGFQETDRLHEILGHYAEKGFSFLYISPHFEELAGRCDRAALFSEGRILKIIRKEEMQDEIIRIYSEEYRDMVHRRLSEVTGKERRGNLLLEYQKAGESRLSIYQGECLVLQIMNHEILENMTDYLLGESDEIGGTLLLEGKPFSAVKDPRIAIIQEQPTRTMVFPEMSYMDNLCMSLGRRIPGLWSSRKIRESIRREYGPVLGEELFYEPVEQLTEKQKYRLVYTRILLQNPRLVVCLHPFKGADLEHRMYIWQMLEMLLHKGIAVVILTVNLSDALSLAERLVIIENDGSIREKCRREFAEMDLRVPWAHIYKSGEFVE